MNKSNHKYLECIENIDDIIIDENSLCNIVGGNSNDEDKPKQKIECIVVPPPAQNSVCSGQGASCSY